MPPLQSERDRLPILRISQDASSQDGPSPGANFEMSLRGETAFRHKASLSELGFPENLESLYEVPALASDLEDESSGDLDDLDDLDDGRLVLGGMHGLPEVPRQETKFSLPERLAEFLDRLWVNGREEDRTLWLDLDILDKHLAVVPWEQLLLTEGRFRPNALNVIRLPRLSLKPASFGRTTNIVICAGTPRYGVGANDPLPVANFVRHIFDSPLSTPTVVHIFTDESSADILRQRLHLESAVPERQHRVIVYDPEHAADYEVAEPARTLLQEQGQLDNPWLNWMAGALSGVTVDVVHFFCDGFISLAQGEMVFSESPSREARPDEVRFSNAQHLDTFLTRAGAYSVSFSSPQTSRSVVGLRLLAAELARLRTGPILLHESGLDPGYDDLCITYRFLYTGASDELRLSPAITLYCPPALVCGDSRDMTDAAHGELEMLWSTRGELQELTYDEEELAWAVAGYRFVERLAAVFGDAESESEAERRSESRKGVAEAINLAAELVLTHARRHQRLPDKAAGRVEMNSAEAEES
jgi:hypothetical protein